MSEEVMSGGVAPVGVISRGVMSGGVMLGVPQTLTAGANSPAVPTAFESSRAAARGRPRLTLRGKLLAVALLAVLPAAAFTAGRASADVPRPTAPATVTVGPHDTLWTLAGDLTSSGDRREVMAELMTLNSLPSASLRVGQQLRVPAAAG